MNLTSFKVFFDTTVLCGGLRSTGINRQLLLLGAENGLFQAVLSRVCLLEFWRHAEQGFGNRTFSHSEISIFIQQVLFPLFKEIPPVNSVVGRHSIETVLRENRPIGEVLIELSGCTPQQAKQIVEQQEMDEPLHQYDQNDFHVWVTAIQTNCRYIVTSNTHRFPRKIGSIERIHPLDFYKLVLKEMED